MPSSPPEPVDLLPVIGYIRVSTYLEEKISPKLQRESIEEWARRTGRVVVRWVEDLDATGRNFKRKIMGAIAGIEAGEAHEIAVWKFSRFGRTRHGVAINLARVEHVGGALQSATEHVDARTATGRFTRGMLFEVAAFESDRAGEQWKETHQWRRDHGLPATGGKRFGYIWHPRRIPDLAAPGEWIVQDESYVPDPETGPVLEGLYERYVSGIGFHRLVCQLNNELGYLNTRGVRWSQSGLTRYLDSGFGAGLLHIHRGDIRCGAPAECQKWREHYRHIPADHPAVIRDEDVWQAYLKRRAVIRETHPRARSAPYPLTGLVRCERCGGTAGLSGKTGQPGYAYRCQGQVTSRTECPGVWVRRVIVEDEVYRWLVKVSREIDRHAVGKVVQSAPEPGQADTGLRRRKLVAEATRLTAALDLATEGYSLGDIPRDSYLRTRDKHQARRREIDDELEGLSLAEVHVIGPRAHREVVASLLDEWDTLPVPTKRDLLASVVRHVVVGPGRVVPVPVWAPAVGDGSAPELQ